MGLLLCNNNKETFSRIINTLKPTTYVFLIIFRKIIREIPHLLEGGTKHSL